MLAGLYVAVRLFDPIGIGRHPFGIPDDLRGAAHADGKRKLTLADADLIGLHFLPVLPQGQTKRRHVNRDADVRLILYERSGCNLAAGELVLALGFVAVRGVFRQSFSNWRGGFRRQ